MLGERETHRWVRLVATLSAGQNKTSELVLSALVRARFCKLFSPKIQDGSSDLFLLGLLSLMDAILEIPMQDVPGQSADRSGDQGRAAARRQPPAAALSTRAGAVIGRLGKHQRTDQKIHLTDSEVAESYWQAMQWARQVNSG